MPKRPGHQQVYVQLSDEEYEGMVRSADGTGNTMSDEIRLACRRHLKHPVKVVVRDELPEEIVERPAVLPKRVGRKAGSRKG